MPKPSFKKTVIIQFNQESESEHNSVTRVWTCLL